MPEGDTIRRAARALHDALTGRIVTGLDSPLPPVMAAARRLGVVGRRVEAVEARGKHLLVRFEGGPVLRTHLGMHGSWHLYKSEVLFLCGVSPFARVSPLDDATLDRLVLTAARLMKRSVANAVRRTTSPLAPFDLWVYGRAGRPCRRCGTTLRRRSQGLPPRSTFWCPACQPEPGVKRGAAGSS
jgi:formamidopyrimidine-DNA glycosylase